MRLPVGQISVAIAAAGPVAAIPLVPVTGLAQPREVPQ